MTATSVQPKSDPFSTTNWNLIRQLDGAGRESALADLCERYWMPIFAYVRRRSHSNEDACELTQSFFVWLLEKDFFRRAAPEKGRLRAFLLTSLRNFLINTREARRALRRGGRRVHMDLHSPDCQSVLASLHSTEASADQVFERTWTLMLIDRVSHKIQQEMELAGDSQRYFALRPMLDGTREGGYREIAQQLRITEPAARQAATRMRKRFRELLIEEVQQTVADPSDVQDEIQSLFRALQSD